ncbi:MAG: DUF3617 domain-containing protein [Sphingorhabdus sp.]
MPNVRSIGAVISLFALASCSDDKGSAISDERAAENTGGAVVPMKPGRWETKFTFAEIDVPTLGKAEKQQIMDEMAKGASSISCLSEDEANKPAADFFGGEGANKCKYRTFDVSDGMARMALRCSMEGMGSVDMDMAGTMGDDKFNFDTEVAMRLPMIGKITLEGTAVGNHKGKCTGQE